ncbi:malonyl-CoA decarboxylase [Gymnodinialimonas sp.]
MAIDTSLKGLLRNLMGPRGMQRLWGNTADDDPVGLSHTLLTARGQASGVAIADRVLSLIEALDDAGIAAYFAALRDDFEVDLDAVLAAAERAREDGAALKALQLAAEPPRQELFRRLNAAPRGTARLVEVRARLLTALRTDPTLAPIDSDLRHLLRSWFNRGFLVPTRIDWHSPADLLEKIIAYEAVHAIDTWDALRQRLVPSDRRCFAFFHPAMPNEPLIFVEVALTKGLAGSIQDVLASSRDVLAAEDTDSAIFYSISNCQAGLAGISFGAFLIKQVASDLQAELPNLRTFSTLSPIPGFAAWAKTHDITPQAAAVYLAEAKDTAGKPLDPVAKFHLGNGAELHRINKGADLSPKGIAQSHGMMVNYLYELDQVEARHEAFAATGELALSRAVRQALGRPRPWMQDRPIDQADERRADDDQPSL